MKFPLDIIWLDSEYKIVSISKNVPPCIAEPCETYSPEAPAKYAIEVKAGITDKLNIKAGDKAEI